MKTKGVPVFIDAFIMSAILSQWTSPADAAAHGEILAGHMHGAPVHLAAAR